MHVADIPKQLPPRRLRCSSIRQLVQACVLVLIFLILFRTFGIEPYQVPTGSMWPALAGNHRAVNCPRCGYRVVVGRHRAEAGAERENQHYYRAAVCPNCGSRHLGLDRVPECPGDHLLVNKNIFALRSPRRWEMAVFRCPTEPGKAFVKRVIGLPGERVRIRDGEVFINGRLARKTLEEFKALRIPVFDNNYQPAPDGFRCRWESQTEFPGSCTVAGSALYLNAGLCSELYQCLVYRHYLLDEAESQAIRDEYVYNGEEVRAATPVHDFMLECDVEVLDGRGWLLFGITDGQDRVLVEVPVGGRGQSEGYARMREGKTSFQVAPRGRASACQVYCQAPDLALVAGKSYHVELAFVDRRVTFAMDGSCPFGVLDLPEAGRRPAVIRPFKLGTRGTRAVVKNVRLFRDIYYTEAGSNGTRQVVSLGPAEYFVLGDNSPNSDDSRFWPKGGVVPEENFIGKPFLAHLPSRVVHVPGLGKSWERILPDWGRMRWLR
jgi:signal peptidase I